jgi:hypothetical protein
MRLRQRLRPPRINLSHRSKQDKPESSWWVEIGQQIQVLEQNEQHLAIFELLKQLRAFDVGICDMHPSTASIRVDQKGTDSENGVNAKHLELVPGIIDSTPDDVDIDDGSVTRNSIEDKGTGVEKSFLKMNSGAESPLKARVTNHETAVVLLPGNADAIFRCSGSGDSSFAEVPDRSSTNKSGTPDFIYGKSLVSSSVVREDMGVVETHTERQQDAVGTAALTSDSEFPDLGDNGTKGFSKAPAKVVLSPGNAVSFSSRRGSRDLSRTKARDTSGSPNRPVWHARFYVRQIASTTKCRERGYGCGSNSRGMTAKFSGRFRDQGLVPCTRRCNGS